MKRLKSWIAVILIFLFGVFCGLVLASEVAREKIRGIVEGGPDKVVDVIVSRLQRDLHLDGDQQKMLQHIVIDTHIKLGTIRQKTQPEVDETLQDAAQKVRGILNPDQVKKFDTIIRKSQDRWQSKLATPTPAPAL